MPVRAIWHELGEILLYTIGDPLTLEELQQGAEEIWALAAELSNPVDMIIDYRQVTSFPRGMLPVIKDDHFALPTLDRIALVGSDPLLEMMITTLTRDTYRPHPTIHPDVETAADFLRRLAQEDHNRH